MDEEYFKITESLKLIKIEKENKERSTVIKDYINHLSTNVNLMREGQSFGEKKKLKEFSELIDKHWSNYCSCKALDKNCIDEIKQELRLTGGQSNGK